MAFSWKVLSAVVILACTITSCQSKPRSRHARNNSKSRPQSVSLVADSTDSGVPAVDGVPIDQLQQASHTYPEGTGSVSHHKQWSWVDPQPTHYVVSHNPHTSSSSSHGPYSIPTTTYYSYPIVSHDDEIHGFPTSSQNLHSYSPVSHQELPVISSVTYSYPTLSHHRTPSVSHHGYISSSSGSHHGPTSSSSVSHHGPVSSSSVSHHGPVSSSSVSHHGPVSSSSVSHHGHTSSSSVSHHGHTSSPSTSKHEYHHVPKTVTKQTHVVLPQIEHASSDHHEIEHWSYPKYEYSYGVTDHHTGDIKSQKEQRDGDHVMGSYTVAEPSGHLLTVHYSADQHGGYSAHVYRDGQLVTPPPTPLQLQPTGYHASVGNGMGYIKVNHMGHW